MVHVEMDNAPIHDWLNEQIGFVNNGKLFVFGNC